MGCNPRGAGPQGDVAVVFRIGAEGAGAKVEEVKLPGSMAAILEVGESLLMELAILSRMLAASLYNSNLSSATKELVILSAIIL